MRILFAGDFLLNSNDIIVSPEVTKIFDDCDYKICNFEAPLNSPLNREIKKAGKAISQNIEGIDFLVKNSFNGISIANNHILDQGEYGLVNTIQELKNKKFDVWGAGTSYKEAYKPLIIKQKIGVIAASQSEFGVINSCDERIGYASITNDEIIKQIVNLKKEVEYVIIYAHAGLEDVSIPLPEWRELYKSFLDLGADMIIASHPHIIQGYEIYKNKYIYYSLGNFIFDLQTINDTEEKQRGLFVVVNIEESKIESKIYPFYIKDRTLLIDERQETINDLKSRSLILNNKVEYLTKINSIVTDFWYKYYKKYYTNTYNNGIKAEFTNLLCSIINKFTTKKRQKVVNLCVDETLLLHNIQIETHRWVVARYLNSLNRKHNKFD